MSILVKGVGLKEHTAILIYHDGDVYAKAPRGWKPIRGAKAFEIRTPTNKERIQNMNTEELAEFLATVKGSGYDTGDYSEAFKGDFRLWLEREVTG